MTKNGLNKLPVVDSAGVPKGLITSTSLLRAYFNYGFNKDVHELPVSEAMEPVDTFAEVDYNKIFQHLASSSAAVVTDDKLATRIVTCYDTASYYKQQAEEFMMLGYIERELKNHILDAFNSTDEVIEKELQLLIDNMSDKFKKTVDSGARHLFELLCKEKILEKKNKPEFLAQAKIAFPNTGKEFQRLTLNDYVQIAKNNWSSMNAFADFSIEIWSDIMSDAVKMRNTLTHFRRELTTIEHDKLMYIGDWFKRRRLNLMRNGKANINTFTSSNQLFEDKKSPDADPLVAFLSLSVKAPTFAIQFNSIEQLLKGILPAQARDSEAWWLDIFASSKAWSDAGWRVGKVELEEQQVTFFHWKIRVNISDSAEAKYWCQEFNCSVAELADAVRKVGVNPSDVQQFLHPKEA